MRTSGILLILGGMLSLATVAGASAEGTGRVAGSVIDGNSALTLPGAPVEAVSTGQLVHTDLDGRYVLELPPGTHRIKAAFSGFPEVVHEVVVTEGETLKVDFALTGALAFSEAVTVAAEAHGRADSQVALMVERRKSGVISDVVASDEMKKNADSNAAAAMQRVTGVSVVDGQYVFVRGLGERYSNTTLNGTVLPTTEPDKRVVPLDLFPTGLVESVKVTKSYLPDKPADFAGGLVEIEPINFPDEPTFTVSLTSGWNSEATFQDVLSYEGGALDWLGFDDGERDLPSAIPGRKVSPAGVFGGGFSPEQLESFGESFSNVWSPRDESSFADSGLSVLAGRSWGKLGAVASVTWNRAQRFQAEEQNYYKVGEGDAVTLQNDYDFEVATSRATLGAVANLAYRFSGSHRLALENFYTHSARNEARTFVGFNNDIRTDIRNARLFWVEEGVLSSKLSGEHLFAGLANSVVEWAATYSRADRDEPDLRETLYEFDRFRGEFVLADESQSGLRMFNRLDDRVLDARTDWTLLFIGDGGRAVSVKVGPQLTRRERDFSSRRFRFVPRDTRGVDLSLTPEELFTPANVGPAFEINEETRATDAYEATQTVVAGYAMVDAPLGSRLRLVGGARVERSEQEVTTFDLFNPSGAPIESVLDNTDVLPAANLIFSLGSDMNLRAAYSHTVNRPEFRELAPFEFTDVVGGRAVVGNPDLRRALIKNVDLRWEWFPSRGAADAEVVALSVFYKDFDDPIERVVEATAQLRTSFQNARGATNRGIELELRKALGPRFLVGANYTFVDSEIELRTGSAQVQTSLDRPLAGQSRHLFNGMLELRPGDGLSARLLANHFSERIVDVGALGLPDIFEKGRVALDAVVQKTFDSGLSLRLAGDNLLDADVEFTQGGQPQRVFRTGRTISLGLSYTR